MSETLESEVITQALEILDQGLGSLLHRELVSTAEMADILLDMRSVLTATADLRIDELDELAPTAAN